MAEPKIKVGGSHMLFIVSQQSRVFSFPNLGEKTDYGFGFWRVSKTTPRFDLSTMQAVLASMAPLGRVVLSSLLLIFGLTLPPPPRLKVVCAPPPLPRSNDERRGKKFDQRQISTKRSKHRAL